MKSNKSYSAKYRSVRYRWIFGLVALPALFVVDLVWGSVRIPVDEVMAALAGHEGEGIYSEIVLNYRLPKAITAILAGSALSVAGLLMQTLFRNPLADAYMLGVSSGAGLGVALVMLATGVVLGGVGSWVVVTAAVAGAAGVILLVLGVSFRVKNAVSLLIVGIMFGTIVSSVVGILQYLSNPDAVKLFVMWSLGSLSAVTWEHLQALAPVVVAGLGCAFLLHRRLDLLLLGENYAQGLGVSIVGTRTWVVMAGSLLAGAVTAFTGPIAFVGIAIPHIVRGVFKTANHRVLIPASVLFGAILILVCDIVSQIPTYTLPINTISSLFGAPVILHIVLKRK